MKLFKKITYSIVTIFIIFILYKFLFYLLFPLFFLFPKEPTIQLKFNSIDNQRSYKVVQFGSDAVTEDVIHIQFENDSDKNLATFLKYNKTLGGFWVNDSTFKIILVDSLVDTNTPDTLVANLPNKLLNK